MTCLGGPPQGTKATAGADGAPMQVEYERFARQEAVTVMRVHLTPGAAPAGEARIHLDRDYLAGVAVERVTPEPERAEATAAGVTYVFRIADPARSTTIAFDIRPEAAWSRHGTIALLGRGAAAPSTRFTFTQLVYP